MLCAAERKERDIISESCFQNTKRGILYQVLFEYSANLARGERSPWAAEPLQSMYKRTCHRLAYVQPNVPVSANLLNPSCNDCVLMLQGFAERKVLLLLEVLQRCRESHNEATRQVKSGSEVAAVTNLACSIPEVIRETCLKTGCPHRHGRGATLIRRGATLRPRSAAWRARGRLCSLQRPEAVTQWGSMNMIPCGMWVRTSPEAAFW